jgi:hypothetical protein
LTLPEQIGTLKRANRSESGRLLPLLGDRLNRDWDKMPPAEQQATWSSLVAAGIAR